jgi:hypothetical protein
MVAVAFEVFNVLLYEKNLVHAGSDFFPLLLFQNLEPFFRFFFLAAHNLTNS